MLGGVTFAFTEMTYNSAVIPPADQEQIASTLEDDAEVMDLG